ncbi:MAG: PTS sugar transporter subunit IIA [Candidatus Omnitrophica bacterium]|nr:PTS sugar transporter subunit IIA [Candidatus Omnitrophota bacterium]MDD5429676.1 PTS sugar transporter subunit IIA [Candidatus Omnitrophota bacterium]
MISLNDYIKPEAIVTGMKAQTKEEAIKILIKRVFQEDNSCCGSVSFEDVCREVLYRESMQTTGVGEHMAFPHARIAGWKKLSVALGICNEGIDFKSLDKNPVNFVCLMVSSLDEPYVILQTMASIIRCLRRMKKSGGSFENMDSRQIADSFTSYDVRTSENILAGDIMRPVKASVKLDSSLEDVARLMHLNHLDVLPVVNGGDRLCGEISCLDIFSYGMPDFFKQLSTVSFVRHIDPFENYFKIKRGVKVKNLLSKDVSAIAKDATLLEIVFQLTVKNRQKLFVVDEGRLVGELDRFNIIDKILFF